MDYFPYGQAEIDYLAARDPALGQVMAQIGPIRRPITPDLFEALVDSIVGQQISSKAHRTVMARIQAALGAVTPATVLALPEAELQRLGLSFRKVGYIRAAAQAVESGALDMEALRHMDDAALCKALVALPGIGVWTAEMLMLFSLTRPNILSYGDLAIRRSLCLLHRHRQLTPRLYEKYRRLYSPHGSVASLYLWALASGGGI